MNKFWRYLINIVLFAYSIFVYFKVERLYFKPGTNQLSLPNLLPLLIGTLLAFLLIYWIYTKQLKQYNGWNFNYKPHWQLRKLMVSLAGIVMIVAGQILLMNLLGGGVSENEQALDETAKTVTPLLYQVFVGLVGPIFEELIFRGLFFNLFFTNENRFNTVCGIIANGFLFGWLHDPTFSKYILIYWLMGSILAWVYLKTDDIRYSTIVHIANNLLSL